MTSIRELEADLVGRRVTAAYTRAVDRKDREALREVFTEDAVLLRPDPVDGRPAILEFYGAFFDSHVGHTRHFLSNQVARSADESGEVITIESSFQFLYVLPDGLRLGWGDYLDVVAIRDGVGRIREKRITVHARTDVAVDDLDEVLRRPPWI